MFEFLPGLRLWVVVYLPWTCALKPCLDPGRGYVTRVERAVPFGHWSPDCQGQLHEGFSTVCFRLRVDVQQRLVWHQVAVQAEEAGRRQQLRGPGRRSPTPLQSRYGAPAPPFVLSGRQMVNYAVYRSYTWYTCTAGPEVIRYTNATTIYP